MTANTLYAFGTDIASNFSNGYFIADFVISLVVVLTVTGFLAFSIKRYSVIIFFSVLDVLFALSFILNLEVLTYTILAILVCGIVAVLIINSGLLRKYLATPLKSQKNSSKKGDYDKEKLINNIVSAVQWLSESKTGALITFERDTPLDDVMKTGTIINCPVTPEIIETIFYEGSRLHDGAIIIRGDTIVAAAVYYLPTQKAVVGKVGARHRAALGISEQTDSVTIVVSEETGRISIAHAGIMDNVKLMEFEKIFRNRIA